MAASHRELVRQRAIARCEYCRLPDFALEPEEETVPYVIERIGADKILFASDYPHWDGMFPHVVSTIRGRKDISEEAKKNILGENAKRFYGWQ